MNDPAGADSKTKNPITTARTQKDGDFRKPKSNRESHFKQIFTGTISSGAIPYVLVWISLLIVVFSTMEGGAQYHQAACDHRQLLPFFPMF